MGRQALDLSTLQRQVDEWVVGNGGYWDPMSLLARLAEEVGELAREYNHAFGAKHKKDSDPRRGIEEELGDLLFILTCMANERGVDLGVALGGVLEKYDRRDALRWR